MLNTLISTIMFNVRVKIINVQSVSHMLMIIKNIFGEILHVKRHSVHHCIHLVLISGYVKEFY